ALLTAGLGTLSALALASCGIRLEDDAPRIPLLPARTPVDGETFLLGLLRSSAELAGEARGLGGAGTSLVARLAGLHARQVTVLGAELRRLGVPQALVDQAAAGRPSGPTSTSTASTSTASASPNTAGTAVSGSPTSGSAAQPVTSPADLAAAELADIGTTSQPAVVSLTQAVRPARPLAGALLAQRVAAAALLGAPPERTEPTWQSPGLASSFLDSTRAAVYGMQVVAAQSPTGAQGVLARTTLATLQAREQTQEVLAGTSAGPTPLGYPLPFPVTTPLAAARLAVQILTELRAANARDLGSAAGDPKPLASTVGWLGETEVLASRWGVPLSAFPGLR
ncbi:MAG: DUF4439 domain-containing protein, partial [Nocardioidaceae bacterium]